MEYDKYFQLEQAHTNFAFLYKKHLILLFIDKVSSKKVSYIQIIQYRKKQNIVEITSIKRNLHILDKSKQIFFQRLSLIKIVEIHLKTKNQLLKLFRSKFH